MAERVEALVDRSPCIDQRSHTRRLTAMDREEAALDAMMREKIAEALADSRRSMPIPLLIRSGDGAIMVEWPEEMNA
ncbi:hypothetical protein Sbs19_19150 [Sphingobium sp. BS19]|nr:hypothetical protein Sbs19_19150 [Sphingobium sp. BS19]